MPDKHASDCPTNNQFLLTLCVFDQIINNKIDPIPRYPSNSLAKTALGADLDSLDMLIWIFTSSNLLQFN
ncbi:MAG: hypothetical protein HQM01_10805 [Magnetococcales bacterium]|nr:hypothetical protein [Magnetococcales bacterium]